MDVKADRAAAEIANIADVAVAEREPDSGDNQFTQSTPALNSSCSLRVCNGASVSSQPQLINLSPEIHTTAGLSLMVVRIFCCSGSGAKERPPMDHDNHRRRQ
jgi:hypothetical protein